MRIISCLMVCALMSSCIGGKDLILKKGDVYSIKPEEKDTPIMFFSVPDGHWSISKVTLKTKDRGWFDIEGGLSSSPAGYAVNFSIKTPKRNTPAFDNVATLLKGQDFLSYLNSDLESFTPQIQKEMKAENVGGKLIYVNGLKCKNTWYQQKIAPLAFNGQGIMQFNSDVTCPLIIDGVVYRFEIGIRSAINPKFYELQAEYNKSKRPEDPEVTINAYEHLTNLSNKVINIFKDIGFNGKVSQNYEDIAVH